METAADEGGGRSADNRHQNSSWSVTACSGSSGNYKTRFAVRLPVHWLSIACQLRAYRETISLESGGALSLIRFDCRVRSRLSFQQPKFAEPEAPFAVQRVLVGDHPAIVKLRALVERVAPTEVTVLITGESGTGKEVVAQAIHALSPRCDQPFVAVNCAPIPHDLPESGKFGHERGAFTGAAGAGHGVLGTAARGPSLL